jgi:NADPH-dependent ferric siderophore reductase
MSEDTQAHPPSELAALYTAATGLVHVVTAEAVTPRTRRITVRGDVVGELDAPLGPNRPLRAYFPASGQDRRSGLTLSGEGALALFWSGDAPAPVRAYTIRSLEPSGAELAIDIVLHDGRGHASSWAAEAEPGDVLGLMIPTTLSQVVAEADWYLLLGDETAVPAIAGVLEHLPAGSPARVIIEVVDKAECLPLPTEADVSLTWLYRGDQGAGTSGLLERELLALEWLPGQVQVFAAGETKEVAALRRHLREIRGVERPHYEAYAYWRLGKTATETGDELAAKIAESFASGQDVTELMESLGMM